MIRSILFFGTRCSFADLVLERLQDAGYQIAARLVPGHPDNSLPFRDLTHRARRDHDVPLPMAGQSDASGQSKKSNEFPTIAINSHSSPETVTHLASLGAELTVVCCYPRRLPDGLVNAASLGGLNVHPSKLPEYRGPDPLFWLYRSGELNTGVTVHRVDSGLDTGAIVRQQEVELRLGMPGDELWMKSAEIGADLLVQAIGDIQDSTFTSQPQDDAIATYYSWPTRDDLLVAPQDWEAGKVFHFCRGVIPLGYTPAINDAGGVLLVRNAIDFTNRNDYPRDYFAGPGQRWIACKRGFVLLELEAPPV